MKCGIRFKVLAGTVLLIGLVIISLVLEDKNETYDLFGYLWSCVEETEQPAPLGAGVIPGDKIIVVPALEEEDVSWVADELPDWQRAIYTVNPSSEHVRETHLTTPVNKGHEAMAYLTYIIDHYSRLPSIVAFVHSHRQGFFTGWHIDEPSHSNPRMLQMLRLDYVRKVGYVNMRCNINPGCKQTKNINPHVHMNVFQEVMQNTSTPFFSQQGPAAQSAVTNPYNVQEPRIWSPCCAQFAVTREQIQQRPLMDYVHIRKWVMETEKDDAKSGRVMEYLWHVIFGQEAITCPDEKTCYCNVYGRCD